MKKVTIAVLLAVSTSSAAYAADTGVYVNGHLGGSIVHTGSATTSWSDMDNFNFDSANKTVFGGGIGIGYDLMPQHGVPVRVELDYTLRGNANGNRSVYSSNMDDEGATLGDVGNKFKTRMDTLLVNTYFDIQTGTAFTPYVVAGVGTAFADYDATFCTAGGCGDKRSGSDTNFAWSLGAGVSYQIMNNLKADLLARYVDGGKVTASDGEDGDTSVRMNSTDIQVGLRYAF